MGGPLKYILIILLFSTELFAQKIAIIGGGTSGVSSAFFLSKLGLKIDLYEAENRIGGNAYNHKFINPYNKQEVSAEMGPLVFATGGWDLFLDMLKMNDIGKKDFYKFRGSIAIWNRGQEKRPSFVTPKFRLNYLEYLSNQGSIGVTLNMVRLLQKSYRDYQKNRVAPDLSIGQWLRDKNVDHKIAKEILIPLFTSFHPSRPEEIDQFSILPVMETTTFRSPLSFKYLYYSKDGIGTWIDKIAKSLENVEIKLNSKVTRLRRTKAGNWSIEMNNSGNEEVYDYVVMATHPHHILEYLDDLNDIKDMMKTLEYHKAIGVLHNSKTVLLKNHDRFLNILKRKDSTLITTMNLGQVHKSLKNVYITSGLNEEDIKSIKQDGDVFAIKYFYHPLYRLDFMGTVKKIHHHLDSLNNIFITGGWTVEGEETQQSATLSGYRAAKKISKQLNKEIEFNNYWKMNLPSLKKGNKKGRP